MQTHTHWILHVMHLCMISALPNVFHHRKKLMYHHGNRKNHHHLPVSFIRVSSCTPPYQRSPTDGSTLFSSTYCVNVMATTQKIHMHDASTLIQHHFFPTHEYSSRILLGQQAQETIQHHNRKKDTDVSFYYGSDPTLSFAYGEFPLEGFDQLLDLALEEYSQQKDGERKTNRLTLIDCGSGVGRLVLYTALSRIAKSLSCTSDSEKKKKKEEEIQIQYVHGIEMSAELHNCACKAVQYGIECGYFQEKGQESSPSEQFQMQQPEQHQDMMSRGQLSLHVGPAHEHRQVLAQADIIFAYSTTWDTADSAAYIDSTCEVNLQEIGALLLNREWNELLSQSCKEGCIVITTDRALDPRYGWKLLKRINVPNQEVVESTGFISILEKKRG